jgi:protein involved in polysaccharide export with SLBB domain
VRSPGAYGFVAGPDILELLSAAGGPTENASIRSIVLIPAITQKRTNVNLQAVLASGQTARLSPGDVVIVPSWDHVRDWLSVLAVASTLVTPTPTIVNQVRT